MGLGVSPTMRVVLPLRIAMAIVFVWFGAVKLIPHLSPAEELAGKTLELMTSGVFPRAGLVPALGGFECLIGFGFLSTRLLRPVVFLLLMHMSGTLLPFFLFPDEVFATFPLGLTLEGQYIIKNAVLIASGISIGLATVGQSGESRTSRRMSPLNIGV